MHEQALTDVEKKYRTAHEAQYGKLDLPVALGLYRDLVVAHPHSREADYSRTQIRNIVKIVIPQAELMDVEVNLALTHLQQGVKVKEALAHLKREDGEAGGIPESSP